MITGKKVGYMETMNGKRKLTIEVDNDSGQEASALGGRVIVSRENEGQLTLESLDSLVDDLSVLAVKLKKQLGKKPEDEPIFEGAE